jgi:hypothetical protein
MKNLKLLVLYLVATCLFTSCFSEKDNVFDEINSFVEFNDAVIRTPAAGRTYPLIAVNKGTGIQTARVNLVGKQRDNSETIKVSVETASTTAIEGVHYRLVNNGNVSISEKNSFGNFQIEILNVPAEAGKTVDVVLLIEGNGSNILPNENYKRIGYRINLN